MLTQIIYRSPAATALLGLAKSSFSHFAKREERADFITELLPDARVDDMRVTGRRADGSEFPAGISARLIEYRGEDVVVSSMDDLTSIQAVQAELAQQRTQVFQAEKMSALGELLAGVAHELNEPLGNILGFAQLAMKSPNLAEQARNDIEKIERASLYAREIIRKLMFFSRQSTSRMIDLSLNNVVEDSLLLLEPRCESARIEVIRDMDSSLPLIHGDPSQLQQVLFRLLRYQTKGNSGCH